MKGWPALVPLAGAALPVVGAGPPSAAGYGRNPPSHGELRSLCRGTAAEPSATEARTHGCRGRGGPAAARQQCGRGRPEQHDALTS